MIHRSRLGLEGLLLMGATALSGCVTESDTYYSTSDTLHSTANVLGIVGALNGSRDPECQRNSAWAINQIRRDADRYETRANTARMAEAVENAGESIGGGRNEVPEHVIKTGRRYDPEPGYTWVNPKDNDDLRVKKIKVETFAQQESYGGYGSDGPPLVSNNEQERREDYERREQIRKNKEFIERAVRNNK